MKRWIVVATALVLGGVLFVFLIPASKPGGNTERMIVSFNAIGPVTVGMTVPEAEAALGKPFDEDEVSDPDDPEQCRYLSSDALPGLAFMVISDKLVRIDVFESTYPTEGGVWVGMTEENVRRLHPQIKVEEHHYDPSGHYLVLTASDGQYGIVFETDGKVVTSFRAGTRNAIALVEGCS